MPQPADKSGRLENRNGLAMIQRLRSEGNAVRGETNATVESVAKRSSHTSSLLMVLMVFCLVVAAGFAVAITRSVVRPVRGLMDRLRSLDADDLSAPKRAAVRMDQAAAPGDLRVGSFAEPPDGSTRAPRRAADGIRPWHCQQ